MYKSSSRRPIGRPDAPWEVEVAEGFDELSSTTAKYDRHHFFER